MSEIIIYTNDDGATKIDMILAIGYRVRWVRGIQFKNDGSIFSVIAGLTHNLYPQRVHR